MPVATVASVRQQIASGETDPIYLLLGEDEVEKSALAAEFADVVDEGLRAFNVERLEPVLEQVKNDDTSIAIEVLSRALSRGVFIHNADINQDHRASFART